MVADMSRTELKAIVSDQNNAVSLETWSDGKPLAHIIVEASELEQTIQTLANVRAKLVDEVPHELDPGSRLPTVSDPDWQVQPKTGEDSRHLILRHPGMGWLAFELPDDVAAQIAHLLLKKHD